MAACASEGVARQREAENAKIPPIIEIVVADDEDYSHRQRPGNRDLHREKILDFNVRASDKSLLPSKPMKEKRAVLDGVAAELRRIIGEPAETELRLVA